MIDVSLYFFSFVKILQLAGEPHYTIAVHMKFNLKKPLVLAPPVQRGNPGSNNSLRPDLLPYEGPPAACRLVLSASFSVLVIFSIKETEDCLSRAAAAVLRAGGTVRCIQLFWAVQQVQNVLQPRIVTAKERPDLTRFLCPPRDSRFDWDTNKLLLQIR